MARCPKELLLRWVQFGCFTPLMQAHARFQQEPWTYDAETLRVYREHVLLHERLVPYVRAAAATAARAGLPIVRPLLLTDPGDARGWAIADAYGYGPSLWVAPVLEAGAREVEVDLPRGDWIDMWTGARCAGGGGRRGGAAGAHAGVGPRRLADRHLPGGARGRRARRRARARAPAGGHAVGIAAVRPRHGPPRGRDRGAVDPAGEWSVTPEREDPLVSGT